MTRNLLLLLLFSTSNLIASAQSQYECIDFSHADSLALTVKYDHDYLKLARELAAPFTHDIYKARAIFKWIANNIAYDFKLENSGREITIPDCEGEYDCATIMRVWENNYIKKILNNRKAMCDGYTKLFKKLCDINHIQNEIVPGYFRTRPYQIGNKISANHSWNAIFIDTAWLFCDVTCASGFCTENEETGKLVKYTRDFQEYYWLPGPLSLARNHFPKDDYWQKQLNLTTGDFFNKPHYYSTDILQNISNELPATGMLQIPKGDSIHFSFDYKKDIRFIQINSNNFRNPSLWITIPVSKKKTRVVRDTWAEKKQVYIPFKKQGHHYQFDYVIKDNSLYYLELVLDYKKAIRYKITVVK